MHSHQQVLDQGNNYCNAHPSPSSPLARSEWYSPNSWPSSTPARPVTDAFAILPEQDIDELKLVNDSDLDSASCYAQSYERAGHYDSAKRLYRRMIAACRNRLHPDQSLLAQYSAAEKRAHLAKYLGLPEDAWSFSPVSDGRTLSYYRPGGTRYVPGWQSPSIDALKSQPEKVAALTPHFASLLDDVDKAKDLSLNAKRAYSKRIYAMMETCSANSKGAAIAQRAKSLTSNYERAIGCLTMEDQLVQTASKLERRSAYDLAEKMIREAIEISDKNLGANDPETIALYVQLAQLYEQQKKYDQAKAMFEFALAKYRKMPIQGRSYVSALESYGDMLGREMGDKRTSEAIYEEARAYYRRNEKTAKTQ